MMAAVLFFAVSLPRSGKSETCFAASTEARGNHVVELAMTCSLKIGVGS